MQGTEEITNRLESAEIPYCIVGGLAAIAYPEYSQSRVPGGSNSSPSLD